MEERIFNLLETMYIDLINKIGNVGKEVKEVKNSLTIKYDNIRLENKMDENHKALYDGYRLSCEKLEVLEKRVDNIHNNIEKQDVEIKVIKASL